MVSVRYLLWQKMFHLVLTEFILSDNDYFQFYHPRRLPYIDPSIFTLLENNRRGIFFALTVKRNAKLLFVEGRCLFEIDFIRV